MTQEVETIKLTDDVNITEVLNAARNRPVRLEKDGVVYRLMRDDADIWADYDPDRVLASIDASAGSITPAQADRWKEAIYRGREEGTRPDTRP